MCLTLEAVKRWRDQEDVSRYIGASTHLVVRLWQNMSRTYIYIGYDFRWESKEGLHRLDLGMADEIAIATV